MRYRLSESQKAKLEEISRPVDSIVNHNFMIAIRKDGLGMHIIEATENHTSDTPIHKDLIPILKEAIWIWEHHNGEIRGARA